MIAHICEECVWHDNETDRWSTLCHNPLSVEWDIGTRLSKCTYFITEDDLRKMYELSGETAYAKSIEDDVNLGSL